MGSSRVQLRNVDVHSAVIAPVVGEGDDEVEAMCFRRRDDIVKFAQTIGTCVYGRCSIGPELVVCSKILWSK